MPATRYLILALLPLLAACAASAPTYVWKPFANPVPDAASSVPLKPIRVSGYVLDAVSRKPVPEVLVEFCGGEYSIVVGSRLPRTDANGHFVLHLPVSSRTGGYLGARTLFYEGQAAIPADTTQPVTLLLKRNAYRFKPYGCQQLADTVHIPPYVTMPILGLPGTQYAFLIRDTSARPPHQLRSVTLRVGRGGFAREPMRIRIYQYNEGRDVAPGDDLLHESLFICPAEQGILTYDLSPYDVTVSGSGFYLALEYIVGADKFWCNDPVAGYTPTGPVLRPPCARADIRTWEYPFGKAWSRATSIENYWPLHESALSVEVEAAPSLPTKR